MTLASLGWGTWWVILFLRRFAPDLTIGLAIPGAISTTFAILGFLVAVLTLRAKRSWLFFAHIPLMANASLFAMPWLAREMWPPGE